MADWKDEIRTPAQKTFYIREVLGISSPKSSTEYKSAYQRLRFYDKGYTAAPKAGSKYQKVEIVAQATADAKASKAPRPPGPTAPDGDGGTTGRYRLGDVLQGRVFFDMPLGKGRGTERREVSGLFALDTRRAVQLANDGKLGEAAVASYFDGGNSGSSGPGGAEGYADEIEWEPDYGFDDDPYSDDGL